MSPGGTCVRMSIGKRTIRDPFPRPPVAGKILFPLPRKCFWARSRTQQRLVQQRWGDRWARRGEIGDGISAARQSALGKQLRRRRDAQTGGCRRAAIENRPSARGNRLPGSRIRNWSSRRESIRGYFWRHQVQNARAKPRFFVGCGSPFDSPWKLARKTSAVLPVGPSSGCSTTQGFPGPRTASGRPERVEPAAGQARRCWPGVWMMTEDVHGRFQPSSWSGRSGFWLS